MAETEIIFSVEESPEGGYEARALGHSIFTQGDTLEELKEMVRDAVCCHFDEDDRPRLIRLHLVKDEVIPV
ncbi:MAG: 2-oxoisovalerate dehydrogenase [Candidatus Binatia bacterium]